MNVHAAAAAALGLLPSRRRTLGGCSGDGLGTAFLAIGLSPCVEQPAQNWSGQGESDCLIKTSIARAGDVVDAM